MIEMIARRAANELGEVILPFWTERAVDHVHGGLFTCFSNEGGRLISERKYAWSQGRAMWMFSRCADFVSRGLMPGDRSVFLDIARSTNEFVQHHVLKHDNTVRYVVEGNGASIPGVGGSEAPSVYADCFVAMGLAALSASTGNPALLEQATTIVRNAQSLISGHPPTDPYVVPAGFRAFGPQMIVLNSWLEIVRATDVLSAPGRHASDLADAASACNTFWTNDDVAIELRRSNRCNTTVGTVLDRHRTPGHALEGLWMQVEAAERLNIEFPEGLAERRASAIWNLGWDTRCGGLFRYVDRSGGIPTGERFGGEFEQLIVDTWDSKLWWVHTEALYCLAKLVSLGCTSLKSNLVQILDYTFSTFPDPAGHEWIQIRDRYGVPLNKVVALPVKDPYHITRNLLQLVELGKEGVTLCE